MSGQSRSGDGRAVLARAEARRQAAWTVLERLELLRRWRRYGEPVVVGSVALGVVVRPDIDLEIVTDAPRVEDGFAVVTACAHIPGVRRARFRNELVDPDPGSPTGLYWRLEYRADDGQWWTIDMWLLDHDAPGRGAEMAARLGPLLTDDRRVVVCAIKESALARQRRVSGLAVCQAVVYHGVRNLEEFDRWAAGRQGARA
jgi:hypothetical protein